MRVIQVRLDEPASAVVGSWRSFVASFPGVGGRDAPVSQCLISTPPAVPEIDGGVGLCGTPPAMGDPVWVHNPVLEEPLLAFGLDIPDMTAEPECRGEVRGRVMGRLVKVASTADIPTGTGKLVEVEGKRLAVFNVDGRYHAIDDTCPHRGGPLSEGELEGEVVSCPWHGPTFSVTTGAVLSPPAQRRVTHYPLRESGREFSVEL
jgi:nitrite reductase (NADH) small subunit